MIEIEDSTMVERTKEIVAGKLAAKIRVAMAQAGRKITSGVTALATTPATSKEEASLAGAILGVLIRLHTTEGWAKYLRVNGAMAAVMDLQDTGRATAPLLTVDIRERTGHHRTYRGEGLAGERDWFERAGDEVSSWFGDEGAERRRRMDKIREGKFRGRGPKGYRRSDERIKEDVNDRLTEHAYLDASNVEVNVKDGEVMLSGTVLDRTDKRLAEDLAESVSGVKNVQNNLRINKDWSTEPSTRPASTARAA